MVLKPAAGEDGLVVAKQEVSSAGEMLETIRSTVELIPPYRCVRAGAPLSCCLAWWGCWRSRACAAPVVVGMCCWRFGGECGCRGGAGAGGLRAAPARGR